MNTSQTSPLLRSIVAGLHKTRKAQAVEELEAAPEEADMAQPEERAEVDIVLEMRDCLPSIEDEACKTKLEGLINELAAMHNVDQDVEQLEEIDQAEEALDEEVEELGSKDEEVEDLDDADELA